MKSKLILSGILLLLLGCNQASRQDKEISAPDYQESSVYDPSRAIWVRSELEGGRSKMMQQRFISKDSLTAESLESIINSCFPLVQVKYLRISNDTLFLVIPDSEVLTQQMGSYGAETFLLTTTWTFTELEGIRHVSFDFEEGDHAVPGVYSRDAWSFN
jgi:hypothetical protein